MFEARHICQLACMHALLDHTLYRVCHGFRYLAIWQVLTWLVLVLALSFVHRRLARCVSTP